MMDSSGAKSISFAYSLPDKCCRCCTSPAPYRYKIQKSASNSETKPSVFGDLQVTTTRTTTTSLEVPICGSCQQDIERISLIEGSFVWFITIFIWILAGGYLIYRLIKNSGLDNGITASDVFGSILLWVLVFIGSIALTFLYILIRVKTSRKINVKMYRKPAKYTIEGPKFINKAYQNEFHSMNLFGPRFSIQ